MDSMKAEKFQAIKYRKSQFLPNLLLHLLAGLACSLCFSNTFWLPSLYSPMKHFLIISLPCIWSSFFNNPKYLFIVVNVIVIFLVGESRLLGPNSSPTRDIYDEYMERSRSLGRVSVLTPLQKIRQLPQEKRVEEVEKEAELKVVNTAEDKEENSKEENEELVEMMREVKFGGNEEKEEVEVKEVITSDVKEARQEDRVEEEKFEVVDKEEGYEEKEREIVEEEVGLPAEELNKRVEEFIARVNKQRWLEARLLVC